MNERKKGSLTTRFMLAVGLLLLVTNTILGLVITRQSTAAIQRLVWKNMLNVSNTAADLLNGDELGALTEDDVGGPAFQEVYDKLATFQHNIDIEYIYAVRQDGPDHYVFTVDPDPVDPGAFGEDVLVTDAMRSAARGIAAVDNAPAEDQWGNYYSAFSPVFDSNGNVAGIVGVDFNAEWYDNQIRENTVSISILSILFVLAGIAVMFIITRRVHKRLGEVSRELSVLSAEMDELMEQISTQPESQSHSRTDHGREGIDATGDGQMTDELEELGSKIRSMQAEIQCYLDYVHDQAYTDALTHVGNTTAYMDRRQQLEDAIGQRTADFGLAMFDINLLKLTNDCLGHARGDKLIQAAASAISSVFGVEHTYRIGGDEFIAVAEHITIVDLTQMLAAVEAQVKAFNGGTEMGIGVLSLSKGASLFQPEQDNSFQEVFVRADEQMYQQKSQYHKNVGDLAERYPRLRRSVDDES